MERIPCTPSPECKYYDTQRGCYEDIHHPIRPKSKAKGDTREARNITGYRTCRRVHEETEARTTPPELTKHEIDTILATGGLVLPNCLVTEYEVAVQIAQEFKDGTRTSTDS